MYQSGFLYIRNEKTYLGKLTFEFIILSEEEEI